MNKQLYKGREIWHISLGASPISQMCWSFHKCMILTNGTLLEREMREMLFLHVASEGRNYPDLTYCTFNHVTIIDSFVLLYALFPPYLGTLTVWSVVDTGHSHSRHSDLSNTARTNRIISGRIDFRRHGVGVLLLCASVTYTHTPYPNGTVTNASSYTCNCYENCSHSLCREKGLSSHKQISIFAAGIEALNSRATCQHFKFSPSPPASIMEQSHRHF